MVIQIHTGEFYYIGDGGTVLNTPDSYWVGWYNSLFRVCVPLFVMLSGYFLFPVTDTASFFKKAAQQDSRAIHHLVLPVCLLPVLYGKSPIS